MKKIMTKDWLQQMFLEEAKKIFANADILDHRYNYIVEKDSIKEGKEVTSTNLKVYLCGFRHKKVTQGYTYKEYNVIFRFSIYRNTNKQRENHEPVQYNIDLYTNKGFTCDHAETLSKAIQERIEKDQIIDTVEFILVRDADQETIKISERFIE